MLAIAPSLHNAIAPFLYLGNPLLTIAHSLQKAIAPLLCLGNPILAITCLPDSSTCRGEAFGRLSIG